MTSPAVEEFLSRFFAPPNMTWPGTDPKHSVAATLSPFLNALTKGGECPLVLPRRETTWPAATYYVICWDTAHAGRMRPLLEAAVAHYWCPFDGRVAALRPEDPIEASILDLVGPGTTYVLRPTAQTAGRAYIAVQRLVDSLRDHPLRRPTLTRPIGRMLREFELALANGSAETSADLLHELETLGGVSHENLAYLQILRLARLGQDQALLTHGSLPTIVYSEPPSLVREAILASWARVTLDGPLTGANMPEAIAALSTAQPDVAMLVDARLARATDPDAIALGVLVAVVRGDTNLANTLASAGALDVGTFRGMLPTGLTSVVQSPASGTEIDTVTNADDTQATAMAVEESSTIDSWLAWVDQLDAQRAGEINLGQAREWPPTWTIDEALAGAIDALPQMATDALLSGVAWFLDTDDPNHPAMRTAAALLSQYLVAERFAPNDLGAICALLEIFLRAAPPVALYRGTLDDLRSYAPQWVAASTAARVLDIADVVASGPHGDPDARAAFVAALLSPLHHLRHRLSPALSRLTSLVASDANLDLVWADDQSDSAEEASGPAFRGQVFLYSLDEHSLARVLNAAGLQWPSARVETSSDKVGNPVLRQHARNADLVVMATRRATHAATGFITDAAGNALIRYADGSGSASLMRAVESGIAALLTD